MIKTLKKYSPNITQLSLPNIIFKIHRNLKKKKKNCLRILSETLPQKFISEQLYF